MIRKLLCRLGFHEWELDVVTCLGNGKEYCVQKYEDGTEIYIFLNIKCKHCGKFIRSQIIKVCLEEFKE